MSLKTKKEIILEDIKNIKPNSATHTIGEIGFQYLE